ncbi:MAG: T9SS type A sorting domain-containing protein [Candidatus Cloacimonetes bacterium]|nr:T9SS type A sorting domain-containing protein [Candidatus Cloacimonadota bacterium]
MNGGGIYCLNSSSVIENNLISNNIGAFYGGGIYLENWTGSLLNNEISESITYAGYGVDKGSGIVFIQSSGNVSGNLITGNNTDYQASALNCSNSDCTFTDNLIINNDTRGIKLSGSTFPIMNHNDIFGNEEYDVYCQFTDNSQPIDFTGNYWGEETTIEMENSTYPTNITKIYDYNDDAQLALINYQEWLPNSINSSTEENEIPTSLLISNLINYPNPFNPSTTICFTLMKDTSNSELSIYNIKGQKVKTLIKGKLKQGNHTFIWEGKNENNVSITSGIYLYQFKVDGKPVTIKKCLLLK